MDRGLEAMDHRRRTDSSTGIQEAGQATVPGDPTAMETGVVVVAGATVAKELVEEYV